MPQTDEEMMNKATVLIGDVEKGSIVSYQGVLTKRETLCTYGLLIKTVSFAKK
jgi:hypothetical protein